jgi:hypothetical protein
MGTEGPHWFGDLVKRGRVPESDYEDFMADLRALAAEGMYFWNPST